MAFKKKISLSLLDLLIKSDFFFVYSNSFDKNKTKDIAKIKRINSTNKKLLILEPTSFLKNLKRILRLLQFTSQKKRFQYIFNFKNEYLFDYLKVLIKIHLERSKKIVLRKNTRLNSLSSSNITFFFNHSINQKFYPQLFLNKKYLFSELNFEKNNNDNGIYKLFVDFNNYKKLIFFVLLLKTILNKKAYENTK